MNFNLLIYSIVTCTAIFLGYSLYYLIKNGYFSNIKIETTSNNKNVAYRKITKLSLIPSTQLNGDLSPYSIYESKYEEMYLFHGREIAEFRVTEVEVWDTITSFEAAALHANDINEIILTILSYIHP